MSDAINITPSFIEWRNAYLIYDVIVAAAQNKDSTSQEDNESDLVFAKRGLKQMREGGGSFSNNGDYTTVLQLVTLVRKRQRVFFGWHQSQTKGVTIHDAYQRHTPTKQEPELDSKTAGFATQMSNHRRPSQVRLPSA